MDERKKVHLSKGILDMKFMKKTKERVQKEADDAVGAQMYSREQTEAMRRGELLYVDVSYSNCYQLPDGRVSFGGMNPDIERFMREDADAEEAAAAAAHVGEKDISDADMAQSQVADNISNRFKTKNQRRFAKPNAAESIGPTSSPQKLGK